MTGPSGTFRGGAASRPEAAGERPTSGANAVNRRRGWRAAFYALVLAGIVGAAAWVLFGSRLLVVRSVIVTGTHLVPGSEILAVAGVQPGTPMIHVNTAQIAARIDTIRQVQAARVSKSWPDRVVIAVLERTSALALAAPVKGDGEVGGGYDLVDADGVVLQWAARRPADLPLYLAAAPLASLRGDPDLAAAAAVLGELPARLRHSVDSVTAPSPDQVTFQLAGGITVLWGGTDRAGAKARELTVLIQTDRTYYDVSAQDTALAR